MKAEATSAPLLSARARWADFFELTKPKISGMALVAAVTGFYMGSGAEIEWALLPHVMLGSALVGGGANALNQWMERGPDALMQRTKNRPLPAGRMTGFEASAFGLLLSIMGLLDLALFTNLWACFAGAASIALYLALYTPLKRITYLNTIVGAVPGALPPLIGWAAAAGGLTGPSWTLFAILFFWQIPHFHAIAWLHREDYLLGGFRMMTADDPLGDRIALRISGQILSLIAASLTPTLWGLTDRFYFFVALGLGVLFMAGGIMMSRSKSKTSARGLLLISVVYLPLLLAAMMLCKKAPALITHDILL